MENELFVIRPINAGDFDWLNNIAENAGPGLTSWPNSREFIAKRVALVEKSISQQVKPEQRLYMFVQEYWPSKDRIGVCGIQANVGYHDLFYNYQVSHVVQTCKELDILVDHKIINLVNNFQTSSELVSFWMEPEFRGKKFAKNLSISRLLYMAQFPNWFGEHVLAELRGVCDENGASPFWDALGRHFFAMDFATADSLTLGRGKQYIHDLIPREPIYLDLLPAEAQAVVGKEHPSATPARKILESQGFHYNNYIDIFDAGPLLSADLNTVKTVVESKVSKVGECKSKISSGARALLFNMQVDARMTVAQIEFTINGELVLSDIISQILRVDVGDEVRYVLIGDE